MKMSKGRVITLLVIAIIVGIIWAAMGGSSNSNDVSSSPVMDPNVPATEASTDLSMASSADPALTGDSSMTAPTSSDATDLNGTLVVPPSTPDSVQPPTGVDSGLTPPAQVDVAPATPSTPPAPAGSEGSRAYKPGRAPRTVTPVPATPAAPAVDSTTGQ